MRPPLHARSTSQRYRCGARLWASVFLNAPFWGQNDAFKAQNGPLLKLFCYDCSVLAWTDPKGQTTFNYRVTNTIEMLRILLWGPPCEAMILHFGITSKTTYGDRRIESSMHYSTSPG